MTEILTESFCERCGTRYTFEPVQAKRRGLGKIGTLGRGFRHFVADPGSSLDEAFAVARSEQEQRSTTHALEAFHRTFNFCLNCRQYTCGDCWNAVEGRCLSCAPTGESLEPPATRVDTTVVLPPLDIAPSMPPLDLDEDADLRNAGPWIGGTPESEEEASAPVFEPLGNLESADAIEARLAAEPFEDLLIGDSTEEAVADAAADEGELAEPAAKGVAELTPDVAVAKPEPVEAVAEPEPVQAVAEPAPEVPVAEPEPMVADEPVESVAEPIEAVAEPEPVVAEAPAAAVAAEAPPAAFAFEPGLNLDEQIAEYERRLAAVAAEAEPSEPTQQAEQAEAAVAEPEAIADELPGAEEVLEPVAAEPPIAPVAEASEVEPVADLPEIVQAAPEPVAVAETPAAEVPAPLAAEEAAPVAAEEPAPVAAEVPEPVAAEDQPAPAAVAPAPKPAEELPVAASTAKPPAPIEPIPTAIGKPLPASVIDGPLAWPEPDIAAAAFEQQWPDVAVPRQPAPVAPPQPTQATVQPVAQQAARPGPLRTPGAHLPSVSGPPAVLSARACPSCGLSLSASARFCRRCGTPQQVDAAR